MRVVFLVPRRKDNGWRDRLWELCKARWEYLFPQWPIYEGHHNEGLFNRSAAINEAARLADLGGRWDIGIVIDSDVMLAQVNVRKAVERAAKSGKVVWAHRRWRGFTEESTERLMRPNSKSPEGMLGAGGFFAPHFTADIDLLVERTTALSWSCCIAIPRQAWETIGGFDARFQGWGFEDMAFQAVACGLVGHDRIEGDVLHLWHPRSSGLGVASKRGREYTREAINNARLGRRYMVALRRDHGITDRPEQSTHEAIERDVANLKHDDEKLAIPALRFGLPDWSQWWPTLQELRDGWLAERDIQAARVDTITVIVHTGGDPKAWQERSAYLRATMESFTANVHGPIVQRVIYDCWGDEIIRREIKQLAAAHGFYVVGPTDRPDFTGSMVAMWRYLHKRAQGDYIFQIEDDFVFEREVDLEPMMKTLRENQHLVQVALLRDACYADERETGGILGWPLPAFTFRDGWFEHRQFWTNNPSLFRRSLTALPWPVGHHSETLFGKMVLKEPEARAAFWGDGTNWIRHIGEVRAGAGY